MRMNTFPLGVLNFFVSLDEHVPPLLRLSSHWLRQVTESVRVGQVEGLDQEENDRIEVAHTAPEVLSG